MYCYCPLCGAEFFYLEDRNPFVSFKVTPEGDAAEFSKAGETVTLTPRTTVYCVTCAWYGEVSELIAGM